MRRINYRAQRRFSEGDPELNRRLVDLEYSLTAVLQDIEDRKRPRLSLAYVSSDYAARDGEFVIVDTTLSSFVITLPQPLQNGEVRVVRSSGSNSVTVVPTSGLISGAGSQTVTSDYKHFVSDGLAWYQ